MNLQIQINLSETFSTIQRVLAYMGAKQSETDKSLYSRIALNEGDERLIQELWRQSRDTLRLSLRPYLTADGEDGDVYRLEFVTTVQDSSLLADSLESALSTYVEQAILAKWLNIVGSDEAEDYKTASAATLNIILSSLRRVHKRRVTPI